MIVDLDFRSPDSYRQFLAIRRLPRYGFQGRSMIVPDEYAHLIGLEAGRADEIDYTPSPFAYDYQEAITRMALNRRKFAAFVDCGLGKTLMILEYSRYVRDKKRKRVLIVAPLMVCEQTVDEYGKFYTDGQAPQYIPAAMLQSWLNGHGPEIGITNYESIREGLEPGNLGALVLDESSFLKSAYGAWGTRLIELGKGLKWKFSLTGTPAPNDRIEFANQAVFLDQHRTVNAFLARYFVNRGETANRWELKPHALKPFYRDLSSWCIFLSDPTVYGWRSMGDIPPIHTHIEDVPLTFEQSMAVDDLELKTCRYDKKGRRISKGGIGKRSKLSQIGKGSYEGQPVGTLKYDHAQSRVDSWPEESTIIWCRYNYEQDEMEKKFPGCASIHGSTPYEKRRELIADFVGGRRKVLISKAKVLGFGLNLQIATRHYFSSCEDSFESFYQCVKRSNRIGSTKPLNVHIAVTEIERPMMQNVLDKRDRIDADTRMQEELFKTFELAKG